MSTNHEALVPHVFYVIIIIIQGGGLWSREGYLILLVIQLLILFALPVFADGSGEEHRLCPRNIWAFFTDYSHCSGMIRSIQLPLHRDFECRFTVC